MTDKATAFAPATIGNVGPGFDVLGLAAEGLGDQVTVELLDGVDRVVGVDAVEGIAGRDADLVPKEATRNAAAIAARAMLDRLGSERKRFRMRIEKGLPLAGGLGGSAASSVAGALAAHLALTGKPAEPSVLIEAALAGEAAVAGRHLDNIAPCVLGGLTIVRSVDPQDIVKIPVPADWYLALVTPAVRVETKAARALLPKAWEQAEWVQQMANTTALAWAFASSDAALVRRALDDRYAEPRRASLIPRFADVKAAALAAGALGCTISGSGPTVFALAETRSIAQACASGMQQAFGDIASTAHVGAISRSGARQA